MQKFRFKLKIQQLLPSVIIHLSVLLVKIKTDESTFGRRNFKAYGERIIFEPLSFGMSKDQKIALIAKNGSGKTSILKIIAQQDTPDQGLVNFRKGTQVSYLPQDPVLDPNKTVEEIILASGNQTLEVIAAYEKALQNPEDTESYQKVFEAMDQHQAWDFESQYKQLLSKLKLDDLTLKVAALSGGQKSDLPFAVRYSKNQIYSSWTNRPTTWTWR